MAMVNKPWTVSLSVEVCALSWAHNEALWQIDTPELFVEAISSPIGIQLFEALLKALFQILFELPAPIALVFQQKLVFCSWIGLTSYFKDAF